MFGHPDHGSAPQDRNIYVFHLAISMIDLSALLPSPIYFSCFHQRFTLPALCVYTAAFQYRVRFCCPTPRSFPLSLKYPPSFRIRIFFTVIIIRIRDSSKSISDTSLRLSTPFPSLSSSHPLLIQFSCCSVHFGPSSRE